MRNLLLFGPFLWFRRVVFWVLVLLLLLVLILYFIANSPLAIKKAVEAFAPDYNITYDSIQGNALSGFEIQNPRYNDAAIAKKMILKWNPNTLAHQQITVSKLHLKEANIEVLKSLASQFGSESNSSEEQNTSHEPLDFRVKIEDVLLSTQAFEIEGVFVSSASLKSNTIVYKDNRLNIENFDVNLESNISNIALQGSYKNQIVVLKNAKLLDINLMAIQSMLGTENNSRKVKTTTQTEANPLMPKKLSIETLELSLLPYAYDPIKLNSTRVLAKDVLYNVESKTVTKASLELNSTTNLSNIYYTGKIQHNQLSGQIILRPKKTLYSKYELPLRKNAIAEIVLDINASEKLVVADIHTKAKQILEAKEGDFNVDINHFTSHLTYDINSSYLTADTQAQLSTPYAKKIMLSNHLSLNDTFEHQGKINVASIEGVEAKFVKPLEDLEIRYSGDEKRIKSTFNSKQLKGYFNSKDFKNAELHIETKTPLALASLVALPPELKEAKASLIIDAPLNLKDFSKIDAKIKLDSNLVNLDADVQYAKALTVEGQIIIPKASLIKSYSQDVAWDTLTPIDTKVVLKDKLVNLKLNSETLKGHAEYGIESGGVKAKLDLSGLVLDISGNTNKKLAIKTKINSVKALDKKLNKLYKVGKLPPIEGKIEASIVLDKLKSVELSIVAPKLVYQVDRKTKHIIKNVKLVASMNEKALYVKSYQVIFNKQKYFATKTAKVELGETLNISNFWINDTLRVEGAYTPALKKGAFTAKAKSFHIQDKVVDVYTKIDLKTVLDGNDTRVEGKVVLLKGKITPQIEGRSFATDSDIIILQNLKNKEKNPFMENLSLMLKVETGKPLRMKQNALNIKLKPDFTINKEKGGELLYLGSVDLIEGSSYIFQKKKFVLAKSAVYFTGNVNKPLLDIKAKYKSINHLITIAVTGIPEEPIINFSSSPSLTREQILSVILFDSEGSGDTHSGNEMMRMMGGAMAKAALSDVGVQVDHLAFGEGNSIEVGKKISSRATVIYINGEIPKVKLKYQHGKRTESVIGASEESQSYDIIYKRDF
jgi:translocation and assembly module TamB